MTCCNPNNVGSVLMDKLVLPEPGGACMKHMLQAYLLFSKYKPAAISCDS